MNKKEYVFVNLYIMLGDADGSIKGFAVVEKEEWEKEKSLFAAYLDHIGYKTVEISEQDMYGDVDLSCYKEKPCTIEEAEVLKKFFGDKQFPFNKRAYLQWGSWRWLTDWFDSDDD